MTRSLLVCAATTLALAAPVATGAPAQALTPDRPPGSIAGTWTGRFDVTGSDNQDSRVVLAIRRTKGGGTVGTVTHQGFCAGTLTYRGRAGGWTRLTEHLTQSLRPGLTCTRTIGLRVKRQGRRLVGVWSSNGQQARGTLTR